MTKKSSIATNYIYNLFYQILTIIVPLFTTPYLSRVLGAEKIGIYSYTLSIATYFILFGSLGVSMYGQREIAYLQDDQQNRSKTFFEILIMRFITLGISLIFFYFGFCSNGEYGVYYKILILEIVANSLDISWYFQGLEEFKKIVLRNTIVKIISVIFIFVLVKNENDLSKYFFIYVLSTFIGNISLWLYLPRYIKKVKVKELKIFKHLKPTISLFIPQVAIQIYTVLDKTMIGTIVIDKTEVGFYEQAQKIVKLLLTIATSLGTVMIPRMANTYVNGNKEKLKEYLMNSFKFVLFMAIPLMFGVISISDKFVPIFYGDGYDKVSYLIKYISPIILAIGLSNVIGTQYLLPTKKQKEFTISVTIGAFVNFLFNMIFIRLWQSIGASIATVLAEFSVILVQFYLTKDQIKLIEIIRISKNYFISGIIMFVICYFIGVCIGNSWISIMCQIIISVIVYILILIYLKDDTVYRGIELIKKKIFRGKLTN